ncbi:AraC family transcriptional regulator [Enterococcus sp. AZ109]|uniref:AraC family transcriptional regulator n=1 Tax=Enterococcus sp. AZ109 TaxID=2774634 RepID=UPI003F22E906
MANDYLDSILFSYDEIEERQKIDGKNINDIQYYYHGDGVPELPQHYFFKDNDIFINKHHRFSYMPIHKHSFVELNYVYSGSCVQYINGEKITISKHQVLMMDKDIDQEIDYIGEEDIIINILIKDDTIMDSLLAYIATSENLATSFLFNASKSEAFHNNYIVFNLADNPYAINLLDSLIMKNLSNDRYKNHALTSLLSLLLPELSEAVEAEVHPSTAENDEILPILKYIDDHYDSVTLHSLGEHFGYNSNYLGNKIKTITECTFQELIDQKRLTIAKNLLTKTDYTNIVIAEMLGFKSAPSLFRLFQNYLGMSPSSYRKQFSERKNEV